MGTKLEPEECFQIYATQENKFTLSDSGNYNLSSDGVAWMSFANS